MAALVTTIHMRCDWHLREAHDDDWESVDLSEIERQLSLERQDSDGGQEGAILKRHWKRGGSDSKCDKCNKSFTWAASAKNCHRCGHVFCKKCLSYKRKLNRLANPDPNGRLYPVCQSCFDTGPQTIGQSRNWKDSFHHFRRRTEDHHANNNNNQKKFNLDKECQRLIDGFKISVGNSSMKKTLTEITSFLGIPEWQKSTLKSYDTFAPTCRGCQVEFSLSCSRHQCRVCGTSTCSVCSSKDLLVYIPDKQRVDVQQTEQHEHRDGTKQTDPAHDPKLAVIKIIGCPEVEPDISLYLRVCHPCRQLMVEKQVREMEAEIAENKPPDERVVTCQELVTINDHLRELQCRIEEHLPKYQELIESLESPGGSTSSHGSNMQILAKAQGELSDRFAEFVLTLHKCKKVKPVTSCQTTIYNNIIRSRFSYYHQTMFVFRELKRSLETSTPPEVLQCIQSIVHHNAMNSCYLSVKQLILEVLHLTSKHHLDNCLIELLMPAEKLIEEELRTSVIKMNEDWDSHLSVVNDFLQQQLGKHRLIRPSARWTHKLGAVHVEEVMLQRSCHTLQQLLLQVSAKCVHRRSHQVKDELKSVRGQVSELMRRKQTERMQEKTEWVIVS